MKDRIQAFSKKSLSLFLALIMMVTIFPYNAIIAEAATDSRVEKALKWAIDIADDNTHGYSQANRNGPDYDCSSFVSTAFKKGGFNVSGSLGTANMKDAFVKAGFTVYKKGNVTLKRGDIMLRPKTSQRGGHTELYLGDNKCVAAHDNYDGKTGDSSGREINIRKKSGCDFCKNADYTYVLRYNGKSDDNSDKTNSSYSLCWPVAKSDATIGKVSSKFGPRKAPTAGASTNHRGIDIPVNKKSVYSAADGEVTSTGTTKYRGKYIVIYHKEIGLSTLYQHLNKIEVKKGDKVTAGQKIAQSGSTGIGTGPHLHYGVMTGKATSPDRDQPRAGVAIDPLSNKIKYDYHDNFGNYKFTSQNDIPDSRTNTTNKITASLNTTANVQSWGYYVGTSKSDVSAHKNNGSKASKFITVQAYTKSGKSLKTLSTTVNDLKPNKTYWYVIAAKIGDKWYHSSAFWGSTTNITPASATLSINEANADIGLNDTSTVTWNAAKGADSYTIKLYDSSNKEVYSKTGIQGNSFAFPASCFTKAGTFTAKLWAVNAAGSTPASGNPVITVHNNVNVTFYDTITNTEIITQSIAYGHNATAPKDPEQYGYTFKKWDKSYSNVKEDTVINTNYEANTYTVKFVDGLTGKVYKTESVKYLNSASAPNASEINIPQGYKFLGWDIDFSKIKGDTTVNTIFEWANKNYSVTSKITSVISDKENDNDKEMNGYTVTVHVKANPNESVKKARLVVALKTESGYLLTETESSAFTLKAYEEKDINVFVPYEDLAYTAEVYTVNEYKNLGPIAKPESVKIDNSNRWSDWIEYTGDEPPVTEGVNGISKVEIDSKTQSAKTLYRYRTKDTKRSYDTSMPGYYEESYTWETQSSGYVRYVPNFPSGFDKGNYYYKQYNKSPKSAYDNGNEKLVVTSTTNYKYLWWHWCRGENVGTINRGIKWKKTSPYNTFHCFEHKNPGTYDKNANAMKWKNTGECKDTYWWNTEKSGSSNTLTVKQQNYVIQKKYYTYAKWSDWSDWSETPQTKTDSKDVETQNIPSKTTKYYRYKTDVAVNDVNVSEAQLVNINGTVNKELAGREVSVYVYKYTQASDYTNEYIGTVTVGENGEVTIDKAKLREAPTIESGDYTIVASVEGCTNAIEIGTIKAPKLRYNVRFYTDSSKKTLLYSENDVEEGSTVTSPDIDDLNIPAGQKFLYWSQTTVNINKSMVNQNDKTGKTIDVYPVFGRESYTVVFVDWTNHTVNLETAYYGDEITGKMIPKTLEIEGKEVSWDMSNATKVTETLDDGTTVDKYIVTQNTVITTKLETEVHDVTFVAPDEKGKTIDIQTSDPEEINKAIDKLGVAKIDDVEYEDRVIAPTEVEESPDYIFMGWKNIETGEYLKDTTTVEDGVYFPDYVYHETADIPEASVKTGEYSSNQTVELTCLTDKAVIYYTTDGTNPETSDTAIQYTGPITLTKSCNLRFYAWAYNMNTSGIGSELYAINTSSSGRAYHLVTIYTDLPQAEGEYYQALIKDSVLFKDDELKNIEGYQYDGLYEDVDLTISFENASEVITESMTLYAHYIPNVYTATFKDENGNVLATVKANYGESAEEPAAPDKEGYVFVGWDSDDYLCMTKDGTFTAKYVSKEDYATVAFTKTFKSCQAGSSLNLKKYIKIDPVEKKDEVELTWSSNDTTVATVDENGVVDFLAPGMTAIAVIVESSGETASVDFTVTPDTNRQITLNNNSILGFDSARNLREIPDGKNTVGELREQFMNDELHFYKVNGEEYTELSDIDKVGTGTVIRLLDVNGEVLDEVTAIMTGDIDGDGVISNRDEVMLSQYVVGKREATLLQQIAVDVNNDKKINVVDCAVLSRYRVGKDKFAKLELSDN